MTDTERLELVKELCAFWITEYTSPGNQLTFNSTVWAQIVFDLMAPITGVKRDHYAVVSMRQKSLVILRRKSPALFEKIKPFLNMQARP
jgi:hypothetical protein